MPTTIEMMIHCDSEMRRRNDFGGAAAPRRRQCGVTDAELHRWIEGVLDGTTGPVPRRSVELR